MKLNLPTIETQEGHLREHYFKNGRLEDSLVFALFKEK